jgi:radical SAM enzyme (TIGR01210 family)
MPALATFPASHAARDRFVLGRRPARPLLDPWRHQGVLVEEERSPDGQIERSVTVFLTGRECPWRCVMCDLWRYTTESDTPRGAIAQQIAQATDELRRTGGWLPSQMKLYNAGSFFDPRAVPPEDYGEIAQALRPFRRVVVESHPLLIGRRLDEFRDACGQAAGPDGPPAIEVAVGLETAHPVALERLHKRVTLPQFARAAQRVRAAGASLRVFLLVSVPFVPRGEQARWLRESVAVAREYGASAIALIPLRRGNGAIEALEATGDAAVPTLEDLEVALADALSVADTGACRVFADLWDVERFATCPSCVASRMARLDRMNRTQEVEAPVTCHVCHDQEGVT